MNLSPSAPGTPASGPRRTHRRRRLVLSCVGGLAIGALCATGAVVQHRSSTGATPGGASRPIGVHAPGEGRAPGAATSPPSGPGAKPVTVGLEPARFAQFDNPTLRGFASTGLVGRVVRGHILTVDYHVSDAAHLVSTTYVVQPMNKNGKAHGKPVTVTETGGIVPMREVASDFEEKGETLTPDQLDQMVDFSDGTAHPVVGDTALVFLGHKNGGAYLGLARMTFNPATDRFEWAGKPPNEQWSSTALTDEQVDNQFGDLVDDDAT